MTVAKTFLRDGIEYRRFTMDIPEALYQLMEATWGRYGKSEQISNILIGVLTGVDHYDHELAALQMRYDQVRTAQASLLELRIQEKQATAIGVEKVQQILYEKQVVAAQEETDQETIALEEVLDEAGEFLDREFRVDNYDIEAPTEPYWIKYYADRVNQHLAHLGTQARVDEAWVVDRVNRRKRDTIAASPRFEEIPDADVPRLVGILHRLYDRTPEEHRAIESVYRRLAGDDIGTRAAIDDYLRIRAAELGVVVR